MLLSAQAPLHQLSAPQTVPLPTDARAAVERRVGSGASWQVLSGTEATATWRVGDPQTSAGAWRLRVGRGQGARALLREALVMSDLGRPVPACRYEILHGQREGTVWLARQWFSGSTTWEAMSPLRNGMQDWRAIQAAAELCIAVAELHEAGWVHANLDPGHAIHLPTGGVRLISCTWACGASCRSAKGYEGGCVHYQAPELVARMAQGCQAIVTERAEVYSLAALLWHAATGMWHLDYQRVGLSPETCSVSVLRSMHPRIPLAEGICRWPELGTVLRRVLDAPAQRRPTARRLARALSHLVAR